MASLDERFYGITIPEYGGSSPAHPLVPQPGLVTVTVEVVTDWKRGVLVVQHPSGRVLGEQRIPPALMSHKRAEARQSIVDRCIGMRRRQQRRRK